MSRSCQRATLSSAATALPRSTRARPLICSLLIGLRLWGIAEEPFWPARKGSWSSRTSVRWRWRISVARRSRPVPARAMALISVGVAVAGNDLRGDVLAGEMEVCEDARLVPRAGGRVGPHRAGDRTHAGLLEGAFQPPGVAVRLEGEARRASGRSWSARRAPRGSGRPSGSPRVRAPAPRGPPPATSRRTTMISPAAFSWSARAVSSTSEEVRPKWIQRPASPAEAASTSTKAATSWSVIRSRSWTASTVKVASRTA